LGDQNLKTENDGAEPVDYNIKKFYKHELFDPTSRINDIALIKLDKIVAFTDFIRPACLAQGKEASKKFIAVSDLLLLPYFHVISIFPLDWLGSEFNLWTNNRRASKGATGFCDKPILH
jgi:hypothetical protein